LVSAVVGLPQRGGDTNKLVTLVERVGGCATPQAGTEGSKWKMDMRTYHHSYEPAFGL